MIKFLTKQPEKVFQKFNGFKFDFYREFIDKCGYIGDTCDICDGECEIEDCGYEDTTDIKSTCKRCGHKKSRYVKYDHYGGGSRGYESQSIVTKNIKKLTSKEGYLTVYNIRYKDEIIIFAIILANDDALYFEKEFSKLDNFYDNLFRKSWFQKLSRLCSVKICLIQKFSKVR